LGGLRIRNIIIRQKPIGASDYDKFDVLYEQAEIPKIKQVFMGINTFIKQFNNQPSEI